MKKILTYILLTVLVAFALLTLFLSTSVIFDLFGMRAKEGNYVLFVVWANWISSILYLLGAFRLLKLKSCAYKPLAVSFGVLVIALIGLFVHINNGGIYEIRTVGAMFFRTSLTALFTLFTYLRVTKWKD